ncbi:MAG: hypothetical protein Q8Q02_09150 [Nocardioides sp.]|nr:hypothetical protein [Nocardioides sp.]
MDTTPSPTEVDEQKMRRRRRRAIAAGTVGLAVLGAGIIGTGATWSDKNDLTVRGVGAAEALLIDGSPDSVIHTIPRDGEMANLRPGETREHEFRIKNAGTRTSLLFVGLETGAETAAGFGEWVTVRVLDENMDVVKAFSLDGTADDGPQATSVYLPPKDEQYWYLEYTVDADAPLEYAGQTIDAKYLFQVDGTNIIQP